MSKTLVKKKICDACGAKVRPGSLFCYNCGGSIAPADIPETNNQKPEANDRKESASARLNDAPAENNALKTTRLKEEAVKNIEIKPIEKPLENPFEKLRAAEALEKNEVQTAEKPGAREDAKLKSAANLRRKAKSFQRKRIEVVWEEPENAPNKWFPIVAVLLILLVLGIFYLAMYLK